LKCIVGTHPYSHVALRIREKRRDRGALAAHAASQVFWALGGLEGLAGGVTGVDRCPLLAVVPAVFLRQRSIGAGMQQGVVCRQILGMLVCTRVVVFAVDFAPDRGCL